MASLNKSSGKLGVSVRANRKATEKLIIHWSAECATEWSKYQTFNGTIEINEGEDRGTTS